MSCRFRFVFLQREKERKLQKKATKKSKIKKKFKGNDQRTEENLINLNLTAFDFVLIRLKERKFFAYCGRFFFYNFEILKKDHFYWLQTVHVCGRAETLNFHLFCAYTKFKLLLSIEIFREKGTKKFRNYEKNNHHSFLRIFECKQKKNWNSFNNCRTWIHQWKWMVTILILDLVNKVYLLCEQKNNKNFKRKQKWKKSHLCFLTFHF